MSTPYIVPRWRPPGFLLGKRYLLTDRDGRFCSTFCQFLKNEGVSCVRLPPECPNPNSHPEQSHRSLKHEWTNHDTFANLEEARLSVFQYIETFYNPVRLHQTLGYLSPDQYEAENAPATAA